jgi:phosphoribosylcarboxyaminoimidazole (NCAIR) mutase
MRFEMMPSRLYGVIVAAAHVASDLCGAKAIITVVPVLCVSRRRDTAYNGHRNQSEFRIYQMCLIYSSRSVAGCTVSTSF